jgi:hypothetical protein
MGDFKDGAFDGKGVLSSKTGKSYRGTWVSNEKQGETNAGARVR